jgi:hypothetical protein
MCDAKLGDVVRVGLAAAGVVMALLAGAASVG